MVTLGRERDPRAVRDSFPERTEREGELRREDEKNRERSGGKKKLQRRIV